MDLFRPDDEMVAGFARLYEGTSDPLHAWTAYHLAQSYGRPVPSVVTAYLSRVAARMTDISQKEPPSEGLAAQVIRALELSGRARGAVIARRKQLRRSEQYAAEVLALQAKRDWHGHERHWRDLPTAIAIVARAHKVSRKTVRQAFNRVKVHGRFWGTLSGRAPRPPAPIRPR